MNNTILTILSLSISGSVLALVLLALRPLVKNSVSKTFQYYIWLLVMLRLVLPLSFDGSIMGRVISGTGMAQTPVVSAPYDNNGAQTQESALPQGSEQNAASPGITQQSNGTQAPTLPAAPEPEQFNIWTFAAENMTVIWLLGASVHFGWFVIAYLRFSRKIRKTSMQPHPADLKVFRELRGDTNVRFARNTYIDTPMMIGFFSPCILIPHLAFTVNGMEPELKHILRHELTHYRRRDLIYKWFVVLVSSLHWFNPLMILVRREISRSCELSCDEAVIRSLGPAERQDYGETLLAIASGKRLSAGIVTTTMCEGKRELKERLISIMTFKHKSVLMIALSVVLTLLIAGCSVALGATKVNEQIPQDTASNPPAATEASSVSSGPSASLQTPGDASSQSPAATDHSAAEAYKAVLQNKAEFFSTDSGKSLYLNDFLTSKEIYETEFELTHFTVLDMDGDNAPEVVLELSVGGYPEFYEVLHYMNGQVNGYLIVYRGLEELKADGTFYFSNGAADYGWGKLSFEADASTTNISAYCQSSQGDTELAISYFIGNEQTAKEAFDAFANEQSGKQDVLWHVISEDNIETVLSAGK